MLTVKRAEHARGEQRARWGRQAHRATIAARRIVHLNRSKGEIRHAPAYEQAEERNDAYRDEHGGSCGQFLL
jgi:hypothetical protein